MHKAILLAAIVITYAFAGDIVSANGPHWIRNLKDAKESARSEGKTLFILFTGHGWCYACEVIDREVFQTAEFVDATAEKYVFVELDFNFGDGPDEEKRKSELMQLRSRYLAPSVPTVVLADSDGRPYAFMTGYEIDSGPKAYLDHLDNAEMARQKRDERFSAATSKSGISRAKLLDEALDCIAYTLGDLTERGDDPLLRFYGKTVEELLELTGNEGTIAKKYKVRRNARNEWLSSEAVLARLKDFKSAKDYAGAINYIDGCLESTTNDSIRWRLESSRQVYLEWSDRHEEALANCQRLLALDGIPKEYRESLLDREAYNLFRLGRVAEGLAHYDQRIAEAADDDTRRRLLGWKAQMVFGRDPVSQSIEIWQAYRDETKAGTDAWFNATALLGRELRRAGRHTDALKLFGEYLGEKRDTYLLLDAAESYLALEVCDRAIECIEEANSLNQSLANSDRQSERKQHDYIVARIAKLKQALDERSAASHDNRTKP